MQQTPKNEGVNSSQKGQSNIRSSQNTKNASASKQYSGAHVPGSRKGAKNTIQQ